MTSVWKPAAAMVAVELGFGSLNVLLKKALDGGLDRLITVVYRQSISTVILIPFAYFLERGSWNKLTARVIGQIFFCSLLGLVLPQYFFMVGLDYTSATFSTAFTNMVPVFTFIIALPLGMEKVNLKSINGIAKVLGTLTSVVGVLMLALYKGIPLINRQHYAALNHGTGPKGYGLGSAFLCASSLAWSSWFLIQSRIGHNFPYRYSSTSIMSFFSTVQSAVLWIITDRNMSKWILRGELQILTILYAGIVVSGLCYVVMSWCVKQKGPVFTSAFSPLIQVFAAILDVTLLHEEIYLGSILGSIVVVVGMYVLLWGKSKDQETMNELPKRINVHQNGQDSAH